MAPGVTVAATFAATLVDEWARSGVRHAVVSPGSRSTPLVTALAADPRVQVHVRLDERSAGFFAIGVARVTGEPCLVVTTSGTAAAEVHAAVVEAHQAGVPLVVCTADRPPELRDVGAPQTVDQRALYGTALRWSVDPGVPSPEAAGSWRPLAARIVAAARDHPVGPGPVHVNLPFREPLVGEPGPLPPGRPGDAPWLHVARGTATRFDRAEAALVGEERGVVIAGEGCRSLAEAYELAETLGWPVLADPLAGGREPSPVLVTAADALLRAPGFAPAQRPAAVLRLGGLPASRVVAEWLARCGANPHVVADPRWPWRDPDGSASHVSPGDPQTAAHELQTAAGRGGARPGEWLAGWQRAEQAAQAAIDKVLAGETEPTEPAVARTVYAALPAASTLVVSASMPLRDLEWFAAPRPAPPRVLANRGANGIDGVVSTALGVAAAGAGPVAALAGDLAFLHDLSALVWGDGGPPAATVVVVDNGGGGIFSFLPQAGALPPADFERLFGTPQRLDPAQIARAAGCEVAEPGSTAELAELLAEPAAVLRVVVVRTDRARNVAVHAVLHDAVAQAVAAGA